MNLLPHCLSIDQVGIPLDCLTPHAPRTLLLRLPPSPAAPPFAFAIFRYSAAWEFRRTDLLLFRTARTCCRHHRTGCRFLHLPATPALRCCRFSLGATRLPGSCLSRFLRLSCRLHWVPHWNFWNTDSAMHCTGFWVAPSPLPTCLASLRASLPARALTLPFFTMRLRSACAGALLVPRQHAYTATHRYCTARLHLLPADGHSHAIAFTSWVGCHSPAHIWNSNAARGFHRSAHCTAFLVAGSLYLNARVCVLACGFTRALPPACLMHLLRLLSFTAPRICISLPRRCAAPPAPNARAAASCLPLLQQTPLLAYTACAIDFLGPAPWVSGSRACLSAPAALPLTHCSLATVGGSLGWAARLPAACPAVGCTTRFWTPPASWECRRVPLHCVSAPPAMGLAPPALLPAAPGGTASYLLLAPFGSAPVLAAGCCLSSALRFASASALFTASPRLILDLLQVVARSLAGLAMNFRRPHLF